MAADLLAVTVDTTDAMALAGWWAKVLDASIVADNDGHYVVLSLGEGRPTLAFQKVEDPTPGKNRLHLDLGVDDLACATADFVAAGATLVEERAMPGFCWATLTDPDGNEFCVAVHG